MRKAAFPAALVLAAAFAASCASYTAQKNLDPESREFVSKVRYIITKQERKAFLGLPESERAAFIKEFWKNRDPFPDSEENEYRDEYYKRIEEANRLFKEGSPGWLQDRGRVYILLGPPWERYTYPRGIDFYSKPEEHWYYGWFVIRFIDQDWSGEYKIVPDSSWQIAELNKSQMVLQPRPKEADKTFPLAFDVRVGTPGGGATVLRIDVPYRDIWFSEKKGQFKASLKLVIEVLDASEKKVWDHQKSYPLEFTEDELKSMTVKDHSIEVQVDLPPGEYTFSAEITNLADGSKGSLTGRFVVS